MSASMYNSPYVYKTPLPKIQYPPFFSGCKVSFKHFLDSKFLALSALLFLISFIIGLICIISPFWFKLVLSPTDGTFGAEATKREYTINTGLFFMNEDEMDNLVELNKNNNQQVVPYLLEFAQVLEVTGICSLVACLAACVILAIRRFASVPANFILAFFATITGLDLLFVFFFALILATSSSCDPYDTGDSCKYEDNQPWRVIPIYPQFYRVEAKVTPFIKLNWTFYISLIVPILTLAGAVLLWLEALSVYRQVSKIRYNQLRTPRSSHENDIDPAVHHKYVYRPPVQAGPTSFGMQPVMFQSGPYSAPVAPPQQQHKPPPTNYGVGFSDDPYEKKARQSSSSSPPPSRRRASPPPARRRSSSPNTSDDSPPPTRFGRVGRGGGSSPPPSNRRRSPSPPSNRRRSPSPPSHRRRSPPPARRGGPPSVNSSMSEGPYVSREIDL